MLECAVIESFVPKDGSAVYQVVVGVTYLLAYDGYGLCEQEPGDGF